jgi:hypothetical protein
LLASGLSDKQIASRLGISHRTVRAHLEKLFEKHGVSSRSGVVTAWLTQHMTDEMRRPADECPFPRPFPPRFEGCPAYQPLELITLDLSFQSLGQIRICRHLGTRQLDRPGHGWYGACRLGDLGAREGWSAAVGADRLRKIRTLRQEMEALTSPFAKRLWELKAQHLQTLSVGFRVPELVLEMATLAQRFVTDIREFLLAHQDQLDDLHLPLDACVELVRVTVQRLIEQPSAAVDWDVPDEIVVRFPDEVRLFFRPPASPSQLAGSPETIGIVLSSLSSLPDTSNR